MSTPSTATERVISASELAKHAKEGDMWMAIDGWVLDVSKFAKLHPGGMQALVDSAGRDATADFFALHRQEVLTKYIPRLKIGVLENSARHVGGKPAKLYKGLPVDPPYAAIPAFRPGWHSPYYNESHTRFRVGVRAFMDKELRPIAADMDMKGEEPSDELFRKLGDAGILACRLGGGHHLVGRALPGGIKAEEYDPFHSLILNEEFCRLGCPGLYDGLGGGMAIGLPPVAEFATEAVRNEVVPRVLSGERRICLAISEAYAGSDAANVTCKATKTPCGRFYEVSGTKKWITNGVGSHYFVTAVRTGGPGVAGVSLLLIERDANVTTTLMKTRYGGSAGTAFVTFNKVRVPVGNLLGEENKGFQCIMFNFNHERWGMAASIVAFSRLLLEECFRWAAVRKAFGKSLLEQPVVRSRLAAMAEEVESCHSWVESLTYQIAKMSKEDVFMRLGGPIALCKARSSRAMASVADNATQIFGGRGITKTGMGSVVERVCNYVKFGAILGGSEEILDDLGIRQASKEMKHFARL